MGSSESTGGPVRSMDVEIEEEINPIQTNEGKKCQRTVHEVDVSAGFDTLLTSSTRQGSREL